jgi:hypothetical protein
LNDFYNNIITLSESPVNITSQLVSDSMNATVSSIFKIYPDTYTLTDQAVTELLNDIVTSFPDDFWEADEGVFPDLDQREVNDFVYLVETVVNSIFVSFSIDPFSNPDLPSDPVEAQDFAANDLAARNYLVVGILPVTCPTRRDRGANAVTI